MGYAPAQLEEGVLNSCRMIRQMVVESLFEAVVDWESRLVAAAAAA